LPDEQRHLIRNKVATTSFLQRLPFLKNLYRRYLPLMPFAIEQFDLTSYDLVISSSYAVAKGVVTGPGQLHISYVHSPMRYVWDLQSQYMGQFTFGGSIMRWFIRWVFHEIRKWDVCSSSRVDHFIANSNFIAKRIWKYYRRDAKVIYPPVDTDYFSLQPVKDDYYLVVCRLVGYKRVDLAIEAFAQLPDKQLVVIGDGPDLEMLKEKATPNVVMMGYQSDDFVKHSMQRAKAYIFAGVEDFGIAPVEAQACGTPVIAYGKGGVLETVIDGVTGVLFPEQTVSSLLSALEVFDSTQHMFDPQRIRQHAELFSRAAFKQQLSEFVTITQSGATRPTVVGYLKQPQAA
jgi:glycosyltransferase involved in cell wall biosynthesis